VFAADRAPSLNGEIYRLDRDGRRVDLSNSPAVDSAAAVSPNGKLVAFKSNHGGKVALYTVRIDGTGLRRVSPFFPFGIATLAAQNALASATICGDDEPFGSLQFTPNGRSLVYQSNCPGPSADIYSVAPNGTGLRRLISTPTDETDPAVLRAVRRSPTPSRTRPSASDARIRSGRCTPTAAAGMR
jgi:Tol biopolymer transport system component